MKLDRHHSMRHISNVTRQQSRENGFALPMTLFVTTFVTLLLASAFSRASMEHRLSDSSAASVRASAVAESGIDAFFGDVHAYRPQTGDSIRYNLAGGYAWVFPKELHTPTDSLDDFMYIVESVGYHVDPAFGPEPLARSTVAQFAAWKSMIRRKAAYVAANKNDLHFDDVGLEFVVTGNDQCSADIIGGTLGPWDTDLLTGPSIFGTPTQTAAGSAFSILSDLGLDWEAIEDGTFIPDYTNLSSADGDTTYATYVIDEFQTDLIGIHGTGLLIIKNRIESYGFEWDGVVIAGKDMDGVANDTTIIRGMLITGMDVLVGTAVYPDSEFGDGHRLEVYYDSCKMAKAFRTLRGFVPIDNAQIDNWSTY